MQCMRERETRRFSKMKKKKTKKQANNFVLFFLCFPIPRSFEVKLTLGSLCCYLACSMLHFSCPINFYTRVPSRSAEGRNEFLSRSIKFLQKEILKAHGNFKIHIVDKRIKWALVLPHLGLSPEGKTRAYESHHVILLSSTEQPACFQLLWKGRTCMRRVLTENCGKLPI